MVISIDGPTASGKSTVAKLLAKDLGFNYLYTGLLYRALAYLLVENFGYSRAQLACPDQKDVMKILHSGSLHYFYDVNAGAQIVFEDENITPYLKTAQVDDWSSLSSVDAVVREEMVAYQRAYVQEYNAVVEGRDIGTVVFPHAPYKFYLTASLQERAQRWQKDQLKYGNQFSLDESISLISERDQRDSSRENSPLQISEGAIVIDATQLNLEETVCLIKSYIKI